VFVFTCGVIFIRGLSDPFGFTPFDFSQGKDWMEFLIALGLALTIIPVSEFTKFIQRRKLAKTGQAA
jgi:phosphotransferase system  glucose/maltose/N-acetylglucosamine-specific IIC component